MVGGLGGKVGKRPALDLCRIMLHLVELVETMQALKSLLWLRLSSFPPCLILEMPVCSRKKKISYYKVPVWVTGTFIHDLV